MSITKETIKETIKTIMAEEADYKTFFKKALEKAGKDIPSMSDEEKKAFFNKIDAAWDGKGEKNEGNAFGAAVTKAKEDGEDEFKVDGKTYKVESVNEAKLNVRDLPEYIFDDPDDFKDWYNGGMELDKKGHKLTPFSKSDERKLFGFVEDWIESRDDNRYGNGSSSDIDKDIKDIEKFLKQKGKVIKESVNESADCGCGCGGVTEGGCSTNLPTKLSKELTFEINTFLERPVLSKNKNKITVENSELSNLIPTLVKNEIHKRLSSGVKGEFIQLLKNYK